MNSRGKQYIKYSQALLSSWGYFLKGCLRSHPVESTECDELYKKFEKQHQILQSTEEHYILEPLASSTHAKLEKFNKAFDPIFRTPQTVIDTLSEETQNLKEEIKDDQTKYLKIKRKYEAFRNHELKEVVISDSSCVATGFSIDWSRKFSIKQINTMLKMKLERSNESIERIDQCVKDNESAEFVSIPEMFNDQLRKLKI